MTFIQLNNIMAAVLLRELEEVGHDAHLHYSHMTLVCTSWCYMFSNLQEQLVYHNMQLKCFVSMSYTAKSEAEIEMIAVDLVL